MAQNKAKVTVLIQQACLELYETSRNRFELLNCDKHTEIIKKNGGDPAQYRPDVVHRVSNM